MIRKPSRLALAGMALVCAAIFAACNCAPTLRYLVLAPNNGTIYVSGPGIEAIRGARRAARTPARSTRRAAVTPQDITTAVCGTLQYAATGYFSDGTTKDQSSAVTWSSSSTSVATINSTGLASGVALGFTNIGATLANVSATTTQLEVDQLNSITMNPTSANIPLGTTGTAFMAIGNFTLAAGGTTTQDISSQVTWASSNMNVATVDTSGNITTVGQGMTNITATSCDGLTMGTAKLTVGAPAAASLQITPLANPVAAGTTVTYTVVELLSDGSTQPLPGGTVLSWQSGTTSVATIVDSTTGLTQALTAGASSISATATAPPSIVGLTGSVTLNVQAATARFAYVANVNGSAGTGSITSFIVNVGSSTPLAPNTNDSANPTGEVPIGGNPQQVLLHPSGDLLFYVDSTGAVHSNCVDSTNGVFSKSTGQSPTPASNSTPDSYYAVIDPTGRFLYVVTNGSNVIYGFTITHLQPSAPGTCVAGDAQLTAITGLTAYTDGTLNSPTWILTDQTGNYLYVINSGNNTISEFAISQTGTLGQLTPLGNSPVATGTSPLIGRIDTNGHLFVANEGDATHSPSVSAYTITASGANAGELTLIGSGPTTITGATDTLSVIPSPNGNYLYVLDYGQSTTSPPGPGQVFAYNLNSSTGVIGSVIGTPQPAGSAPFGGMAIDPTGALLVLDNSNDNDLSMYTISQSGTTAGGLTPTSPATISVGTGTNPEYVVLYTAASGQ